MRNPAAKEGTTRTMLGLLKRAIGHWAAPRDAEMAALPLVMLPGTLCDQRLFAPLDARLDTRASILLPLEGGSAAEAAAAILAAAPSRFALLGFSLGGIVALEVAAQAPERVAGLALIGANARALVAGPDDHRIAAWRTDDEISVHVRRRLWPAYVAASQRENVALQDVIVGMAEHAGKTALAGQLDIMRNRADSRPRLGRCAAPALVLAGAEDALCPPALQRELAAGLPDASLVLIEGAGHFVPLEAPDAVARHVRTWLDRVDAHAQTA